MTATRDDLMRSHLRFGWWGLLVFLVMGTGLEALHALKLGFYVDVDSDTRRMLWTLAHAHGALVALIHLGFAATLSLVPGWSGPSRDRASMGLTVALVLIPGGFFLGGAFIYDGDPGPGIFLLPIGALALFLSVWWTAMGLRAGDPTEG